MGNGRARDVCARLVGVTPREGVHAVLHSELHDAVIGRLEFDFVDAVAIAIVGLQLRLVLIRRVTECDHLAAGHGTELAQTLGSASGRESVCQSVYISGVSVTLKTKQPN